MRGNKGKIHGPFPTSCTQASQEIQGRPEVSEEGAEIQGIQRGNHRRPRSLGCLKEIPAQDRSSGMHEPGGPGCPEVLPLMSSLGRSSILP